MEIKNEDHAREMLLQWQKLPSTARKREIHLALKRLELSAMYYEQKGNQKGGHRANHCISILTKHLDSLE